SRDVLLGAESIHSMGDIARDSFLVLCNLFCAYADAERENVTARI
ncbi:MAG: hypothetical protein JWR26_1997, partial [Pedosphaera sp.]|nr:hypothetical protein [Pedosphaera sp.]